MKYVSVKGFESLAVAALRELRAEKDAQIATLEARNAELERRVAELEASQEARLVALEKALLGKAEESLTSPTQTR
jgi:cell division protein FtsB